MLVNVGSKNIFKIDAVKDALRKMELDAKVCGFKTESRVSAQPMGEETFTGARNRALAVRSDKADFTVGIESGIEKKKGHYFDFAVVHIIRKDGKESFATTSHFALPRKVGEQIDKGLELSDAIDIVYNVKNSKETLSAVGVLTDGAISLRDILFHATILALSPLVKEK
ncbi:MAG: DUF84 family protein [Candidatus Micrarchaeota archaeon]|nr:DUF84 family protein [Candidatus Micrarchaeota archaeon]